VDFKISARGKYLGWYLGRDDVVASFTAPLGKFQNRLEDIVQAGAPVASAILRFNQRAVPVLSFVAQFAECPHTFDLPAIQQKAIHSILRLPPNSLTRTLADSVGVFTDVDPLSLVDFCAACRLRFAYSVRSYLFSLADTIKHRVYERLPFSELKDLYLPSGCISSPPILSSLIHALQLQGVLSKIRDVCRFHPEHSWILNVSSPNSELNLPNASSGLQTACLRILKLQTNPSCVCLH